MPHLELPDGQSAELIEIAELTERQRRLVRNAWRKAIGQTVKLEEAGLDTGDPKTWHAYNDVPNDGSVDEYQDALVGTFVKSWTLGLPLPTTETACDVPAPIYDEIVFAAANLWAGRAINFTPDGAADPKADTEGSSPSGTSETETPETTTTTS